MCRHALRDNKCPICRGEPKGKPRQKGSKVGEKTRILMQAGYTVGDARIIARCHGRWSCRYVKDHYGVRRCYKAFKILENAGFKSNR